MIKESWLIFILSFFTFINASAEVVGGSFEELNAEIKKIKKTYPPDALKFELRKDEDDSRDCPRCPAHFKLTSAVNDILTKLARDPAAAAERLPLRVSKLRMQFYAVKSNDLLNNQVRCQTFDSAYYAMTLADRRMKGQAKLIAEEFFDNKAFDNLLINDPQNEKVIYYFRDDYYRDVLVQVVVEKGKNPVIRYFKYTPSSNEDQVIDLPNLGEDFDRSSPDRLAVPEPLPIKTEEGSVSEASPISGVNLRFRPKMERRGFLPRDYYIGDATLSKELFEGVLLSGESKLSVAKGNEASLRLNTDKGEVLQVRLTTRLNGNTEHAIVVPYAINLNEADGTSVRGAVQDETNSRSLSLSLVSDHSETIRATARQNKETGNHSVILSKDVKMQGNSVINLSAGRDETSANFVAARHTTIVNKSTSMVVDFKLDSERRTTLYYTLTTRF